LTRAKKWEPPTGAPASGTLELVPSPSVKENEAPRTASLRLAEVTVSQLDLENDPEKEARKLNRALVHATVFLTRGPFLIEEARKATDAHDDQALKLHARTLRLCAWHVSRGRMVQQMSDLEGAAELGDFNRARGILDQLAPEFSQLVSRISQLLLI